MKYLTTTFMLFLGNMFYQGFADCDFKFAITISFFQAVAAFTFWLQERTTCKPKPQYK